MTALIEYIRAHTIRGACTCGECDDASPSPEVVQLQEPNGHGAHTVDMVFFKVAINPKDPPDAGKLRELIISAQESARWLDLFDGKEHDYCEVGDWIGDQTLALILMGVGALKKLWTLHTPAELAPGSSVPRHIELSLAHAGCISISANPSSTRAQV